jgi:hypothetical protein
VAAIVAAAVFLWISIGAEAGGQTQHRGRVYRWRTDRRAIWWKARFPFQMVAVVVRRQVPPDPIETVPPQFSIDGNPVFHQWKELTAT